MEHRRWDRPARTHTRVPRRRRGCRTRRRRPEPAGSPGSCSRRERRSNRRVRARQTPGGARSPPRAGAYGSSVHSSTIVVSPVKSHHYSQHAAALRTELGRALARDVLRELHRKVAARHLVVAARQFAILGLATWALVTFTHPLVWIPIAVVQGFTVFN